MLLYQVVLNLRLRRRLKLNYLCIFFFSQYYIHFLVLSINYACNRGKTFSFVYESKLHQTLFHWSFITPRSDIAFTSCRKSPPYKISRLKAKPRKINDSEQGVFLQLCCLVGSNFSNSFSLVSTLNSVKVRKLKVGLSYSWTKTWKR